MLFVSLSRFRFVTWSLIVIFTLTSVPNIPLVLSESMSLVSADAWAEEINPDEPNIQGPEFSEADADAADPSHAPDIKSSEKSEGQDKFEVPRPEKSIPPTGTLKAQQDSNDSPPMAKGPTTSGAATAEIPLPIPKGRQGITPSLNLYYNSMSGKGWLGHGWDMEIGSVQKRGDKYYFVIGNSVDELIKIKQDEGTCVGKYDHCEYTKTITYALKSKRTAVLINDQGWTLEQHYVPATGDAYTRYTQQSSHWAGKIENLTYDFGKWNNSHNQTDCGNAYQKSGSSIFSEMYGLRTVTDTYDNKMEIQWGEDAGQISPASITYPGGYSVAFEKDTSTGSLDIKVNHTSDEARAIHYRIEYKSGEDSHNDLIEKVWLYGTDGGQRSLALMQWNEWIKDNKHNAEMTSLANIQGGTITFEYTDKDKKRVLSKLTVNDGQGQGYSYNVITSYDYTDGDSNDANSFIFKQIKENRPDGTHVISQYNKGNGASAGLPEWVEETGPVHKKTSYSWGSKNGFVRLAKKTTEYYKENGEKFATPTEEKYSYVDDNTCFHLLDNSVSSGPNRKTVKTQYYWSNVFPSGADNNVWWRPQQTLIYQGESSDATVLLRNTQYKYNEKGSVQSVSRTTDNTESLTEFSNYDLYGNPQTITDPRKHATNIEYDELAHMYPAKITRPSTGNTAHISSTAYDLLWGKVLTGTDENEQTTSYLYDQYGRPTGVIYPNDGRTFIRYTDYDSPSTPSSVITERLEGDFGYYTVPVLYEYYDGMGRIIQKSVPADNNKYSVSFTQYNYAGTKYAEVGPISLSTADFRGNPYAAGLCSTNESEKMCPTMQYSYDYRGRLSGIYKSLAPADFDCIRYAPTQYKYALFARTIVDPDGNTKTENYNDLGKIVKVEEELGSYASYTYNGIGELLDISRQNVVQTKFTYNMLGKKTSIEDADRGKWSYEYDVSGNLKKTTGPDGQIIENTYDELNRKTAIAYTDPGICNDQGYCTPGQTRTTSYEYDSGVNGIGRLYRAVRGDIENRVMEYDAMGRVLRESKTYYEASGGCYITSYGYDVAGRQTSVTHPDNKTVAYTYYSGTALLSSITDQGGKMIAQFQSYNPAGRVGSIVYGNGVESYYGYQPLSMRLEAIYQRQAGVTLQGWSYEYTDAGDMESKTNELNGATYFYDYDKLHRLTGEILESNDDLIQSNSYSYDVLGNLTQKSEYGVVYDYRYNSQKPNKLDSIETEGVRYDFTYDNSGNVTSGPILGQYRSTRRIAYGADGMPKVVRAGEGVDLFISTFAYDAAGERAKKDGPGGITYYVSPSYEIGTDGKAVKYITAGRVKLAKIVDNEIKYLHQDHLGSTTLVTNDTGNAVESTDYMPFGAVRNGGAPLSSTNYKFTGQEYDPETGRYYYHARYYDPALSRFIMPDPLIPDMFGPQSHNPYSYCLNNPLKYVDPSGAESEEPGGGDQGQGGLFPPEADIIFYNLISVLSKVVWASFRFAILRANAAEEGIYTFRPSKLKLAAILAAGTAIGEGAIPMLAALTFEREGDMWAYPYLPIIVNVAQIAASVFSVHMSSRRKLGAWIALFSGTAQVVAATATVYAVYDKEKDELSTSKAIGEGFKTAVGSIIAGGLGYAMAIAGIPAIQRTGLEAIRIIGRRCDRIGGDGYANIELGNLNEH
ncbi:MAG: hypothetical protein CSYNP_02632 [Syntrophus sp. SKADARSKE-3]|nr:hypothetical protein [Syntrophus sp. SKADARSKE-3]